MQLSCSLAPFRPRLNTLPSPFTAGVSSTRKIDYVAGARALQLVLLAFLAAWSVGVVFLLASGERGLDALIPVTTWRIQQRVEPLHPLVQKWAQQIRLLSSDRVEQAALAEQTVWRRVRYWDETDIWGHHYIPRIEEMETHARNNGWDTLRGNCISQSIVLCSLLRALDLPAHIEATPSHAWVEFMADGQVRAGLKQEGGPNLTPALPPPFVSAERIALAQSLGASAQGRFEPLSALPDFHELPPYFEQPAFLFALPVVVLFWIWLFIEWDRASFANEARLRAYTRQAIATLSTAHPFAPAPRARLRKTIKAFVLAS